VKSLLGLGLGCLESLNSYAEANPSPKLKNVDSVARTGDRLTLLSEGCGEILDEVVSDGGSEAGGKIPPSGSGHSWDACSELTIVR